jgi:predicted acetyltransferase
MSEPTVRTLHDDERFAAAKVVNQGMLGNLDDAVNQAWADIIDAKRCLGAFSPDGELVGLTRDFPTDLTAPGGAQLPAAGVTAVAVLSTHRRRGHLSRLMHAQLAGQAEEGIRVALLVAAEWPIYGRFGYGPAIDACKLEVDAATARFRAAPAGSIELVTAAELRPHIESAHEARRARTPGSIRREAYVWDRIAGLLPWPGQPDESAKQRGALWRDDTGAVQGAVAYKVEDIWDRNRPAGRADVHMLVGATPEAERELWRHLCEIDWVRTVSAGNRGVDDPLPFFVEDGRAVTAVDHFDCIWARILDLPGTLGQRRAASAGRSVVEVVDPLGHAAGRWELELGPDGADVSRTTAEAEVTLPVSALSAAYLGGRSLRRLHEAGWADEGTSGGIDRLDALLSTPTAPWSPTTY